MLEYVSTNGKRVNRVEKKRKSALHKGHRERMKKRYLASGIEGFQEHEMLEFLLFFAIPFKDTNELAHDLINTFGSFNEVLLAPPEQLKSFKNMTRNAVILLKFVSNICKIYCENQNKPPKRVNSIEDIKTLLLNKYYGVNREVVSLILLDNKNKIIDCMSLKEGNEYTSEVMLGEITKIANARNVSHIMLAHNHPDGKAVSTDDIIATKKAVFFLKGVNIDLCDSFVLANERVISINKIIEESAKNNAV